MASDTATEALVILNNTPVSPVDPVIENPIVPLGDLAWTHAMEQAMYSEMVNQHRLFKRAAAGFKSEAWVPILAAIQAVTTTGHRVNKLQCQGKTSNHKAKWAVWRHLLIDLSGWGWDPVTKLLLAEDDQWKMQIKKNRVTSQLRNKPLYFTVEFDELFVGKTATGNHVQAINPSAADTVIIDPNLSDIPPSGITLPPTPQGTPQAGDQEEQGLSDLEEQTPQTVAKKRHASSQLSVSTPPLKRQKKTGGQYMGMAIGDVGEGMKRSVAQREIEATQRAIEEAQRIKETPQAIIAKAMALLREDTDPEDSDFIIEAATVFLDDRKAYMYTMLEGGMRLIWLQQIIDARN